MPRTSMPLLIASMVTELMTPLMPGAGPPPTIRASLPEFGSFAMDAPHVGKAEASLVPRWWAIARFRASKDAGGSRFRRGGWRGRLGWFFLLPAIYTEVGFLSR